MKDLVLTLVSSVSNSISTPGIGIGTGSRTLNPKP